ncbi:MAG TPA: ribose-5-phosphate isomerase RpiA [Bryobacteraceae bacterium]|nr:ribose-5-phosphate isomerase RpiA [Bryobacteraceae bacterium]
MNAEQEKRRAAEAAAAQVEDGMIVGLGSGTTAAVAVEAIGRLRRRILGIPTSEKTAALARQCGIELTTLAAHPQIDLTIDGADEIERGTLALIKGRGGALLREKIVAASSRRLVIVADESKVVDRLSAVERPIPVEVVPFGWETTAERLRALGAEPKLREGFLTDGGHYILDCLFPEVESPAALAPELDGIVGVVEHGLFLGLADEAIVAFEDGVKVLQCERRS